MPLYLAVSLRILEQYLGKKGDPMETSPVQDAEGEIVLYEA